MAQVSGVVEKVLWRRRGGLQIYGPVHECLASANGKDYDVHIVDRNGLDHHRLGSTPPTRLDVGLALLSGWLAVDALRELRRQAYQGVRGKVAFR
jgi:hypothetical protein